MSRVVQSAQVAQSCDFTAQQILGNLVIDVCEIDGLDGNLKVGFFLLES